MTTDIWQIEFRDKDSGLTLTAYCAGIGIGNALENLNEKLGYRPTVFKASLIAPLATIRTKDLITKEI